jgi:hypothetical protein
MEKGGNEHCPLAPLGLCRNDETAYVILNKVKNLMHSILSTTQILWLGPQNDIATQSLEGEEVNNISSGMGLLKII